MVVAFIHINNDVWLSVKNRKSNQITNEAAVEYILMNYLISVYPKEKETNEKIVIDKFKYTETLKRFQEILKEVKDKNFQDLLNSGNKNANNA
jgi:hypothetical protein